MSRSVRWEALLIAAGALALLTTPLARSVAAQTTTGAITGVITDASTQRPLPSAQVFIAGTRFGALTNGAGEFRLPNIPPGPAELRVRLIGYGPTSRSVTVTAGETVQANFTLSQSAVTLTDVVVTGTGGAVEEKKLGNTVAKIELSDLQNAPIQTPTEILQGRVPGVSSLPSSGQTGEGARIRIRGNASLTQSNEAVLYIDGVRADNGGGFGDFVGTGGGGSPSRLDDIDPNAIERIEILKGAAAATLFGTEASNGVIQIFTKRGTAGPPRWTFQAERSAIEYPDRIHPNAGFARTQVRADSLSRFYGFTIRPFEVFERKFNDRMQETGFNNTLAGSVSGGSPAITYFVSGRYAFEDGPFTSEQFNGFAKDENRKYQGTLNLSLFPRDNLRMGFRAFYSENRQETPGNNNNIYAPYTLGMFGKPERVYCVDNNLQPSFQNLAGGGRCQGAGNELGNVVFSTAGEGLQERIFQDAGHFNGVLNAAYLPFSSLTLEATVGIDDVNARSVDYAPFGNNIDLCDVAATGCVTSQNDPLGYRSLDLTHTQNVTLDMKGSWNRDITSRLNSTLVFGGQGFISERKVTGSFNHNFPGPGIEIISGGNDPTVYERLLKVVNAGFFGQEQLGINNWIFLTAGARYDFNSAFGESAGGVLYPKASVSVVPSDLAGWNNSILSTIRLRAAYGQSGRQPGAFDKFTTYLPLESEFGGGLAPDNLGNQNLKPEISTEVEAGTELGLFSNRIGLNLTYWNRVVSDALVSRQFPLSGGFYRRQLDNIGELKAHGSEIGVNAFVVNRPNVAFDVFANGAYIWQKVTSLGGAPPLKVGGSYPRYRNFLKEGFEPGALLGAKLVTACSSYAASQATALRAKNLCLMPGEVPYGVSPAGVLNANLGNRPLTQAEFLARLGSPINATALNPLRADDDLNGDALDHYLGKPYPDWQGGFGGNLRVLRDWRVQTLFEYKAGNYTVTNLTDAFRRANPSIGRNVRPSAEVEAVLENPASTAQQRYDAAIRWLSLKALSPYDGLNQNSNGDFVRWRELSLTYTAPSSIASRLSARDMALTFGVRNLKLWTKYDGTDPEANAIGRGGEGDLDQRDENYLDAVDAFAFPLARRYTLSLRLGF